MINVLLITFVITLLYIAIANRLLTYVKILAFQGILLFGVAFIELLEINPINLAFILLETIIVKTIAFRNSGAEPDAFIRLGGFPAGTRGPAKINRPSSC